MTLIEHDAWWGWQYFRSRLQGIWNLYSRYGEVVLEKDLEEDDEKFKPLFRQANGDNIEFIRIIREFWENNYHFVASDFNGLINLLKKYREAEKYGALRLLPETGSYYQGETRGCDETYSITVEFYDQLKNLIKEEIGTRVLLVNYGTKQVIEIEFSKEHSPNNYKILLVHEPRNVIEIQVVSI